MFLAHTKFYVGLYLLDGLSIHGNDEILKQMNKGGTQTGETIKEFVKRLYPIGIIPELSFVLGMPAETPEKVMAQIEWDINFIKEVKQINPDAEIIIYLYSPVATEGSELYEQIQDRKSVV